MIYSKNGYKRTLACVRRSKIFNQECCTSGGHTTVMEHADKLPYGVSTFLQEQHAYTISVYNDTLEIVEDKKVSY